VKKKTSMRQTRPKKEGMTKEGADARGKRDDDDVAANKESAHMA
jgi:hypothetical protein